MRAANRYHPLSIGLHWLMAAMMIALVAVGFVMEELPKGDLKFAVFNTHKLVGVVVFVLVAVRLAWRAGHPPPAADDIPAWQHAAARVAHVGLYAAMIVMPLSGLLFTNFGKGIHIFGLTLAPIGGANEAVSHFFKEVHEVAGFALAGLIVAHAAAALWHHFGRRDKTLLRMLPQGAGD
jgi:cytochrome b561